MNYDAPHDAIPEAYEDDTGLSLRDYWYILLKRIWYILFVVVLVSVIAALYTFRQPKIYQAKVTLIIEPGNSTVLEDLDISSQYQNWFMQGQVFETQIKVLQSRFIAERVVRELGLAENLEFLGLNNIQDETALARALENSDPAARVMGALSVQPVDSTLMLELQVTHGDPELAALLANGVAEVFQEQNNERRVKALQDAFHWLEDQVRAYEARLKEAREELNAFKRNKPLLFTNPTLQQELVHASLQAQRTKLVEAEDARRKAEHDLRQIKRFKNNYYNAGSLASILGSETLSTYAGRYLDLKQQETELSQRFLDEHPKMIALRDQIDRLEEAIKSEIRSSRALVEDRYNALRATEQEIRARVADMEQDAGQIEEYKLLYEQVASRKAEQQRLYELVQRRMNEVNLSQLLETNNVRILDRAMPPSAPIQPKPLYNMLIAVALGLGLGIGLALLLEVLDRSIKTQDDVERYLPFLGVLPTIHKRDRGRKGARMPEDVIYTPDLHVAFYPRSSAAECMRTIRTNLLFMTPGQELHTVVITSPSPLEGKTTSAVSLATVMAQSNSRVALVDLDMRKPRLYKAFQIEKPEYGSADVLLGRAKLDDVIVPTGIDRLDLIPCGGIPPNPSELLHTPDFVKFLEDLQARYDRVILDSPPVVAVTDAMVIAQHADGLILICRSHSTRRELLARATELLRGINAPILGAILNNVNLQNRRQGSYYYYYYKHYGKYYERDELDMI